MTEPRNRWSPPPYDPDPRHVPESYPGSSREAGRCPFCGWLVGDVVGHVRIGHPETPGYGPEAERGASVGLVLAGFVGALVGFGLGLAVAWAVLS